MAKPIQVVVHIDNGVLCCVYSDSEDVVVTELMESDDEHTEVAELFVHEMGKPLEELLQELAG